MSGERDTKVTQSAVQGAKRRTENVTRWDSEFATEIRGQKRWTGRGEGLRSDPEEWKLKRRQVRTYLSRTVGR